MTQAFKDIIDALKERASEHGEEVKVNFVKKCLQRVNPKVMTIMNIANDTEWKFIPRPDDAPEKGSDEETVFIKEVKDRYYKQWLERVNKGEFDKKRPDMHIGEDAPEEDASEEVDMAALARAEKEKAKKKATPVAVINEPEDDRRRYEEEDDECMESCSINEGVCPKGRDCDLPSRQEDEESDRKLVDAEADQFCKELPDKVELKREWRGSTSQVEVNLLHALNDFIASTDSPPEDTPSFNTDFVEKLVESTVEGIKGRVAHLEEENAKLKRKVTQLFNALRDE